MASSPATSPQVSVVIVAWRSRDDVLRCLASLERHAGLPYEAIVVDDGSGDGTAEAVRDAHPEALLLAKPRNEGLVRGRNSALPHVRGRHVLMLDADTMVTEGAMPALARVLDANPGVGLVGPRLLAPDGELQHSCRRWPSMLYPLLRRGPLAKLDSRGSLTRFYWMEDWAHDAERPVASVLGAAQMWRRELVESIGCYDTRISSYGGEDIDWCYAVWRAGYQVRYVPAAQIVHVWQRVTRQQPLGRKSFRQLADFYYLHLKHRELRRDPRLAEAQA